MMIGQILSLPEIYTPVANMVEPCLCFGLKYFREKLNKIVKYSKIKRFFAE
jgi:hypothetical protein